VFGDKMMGEVEAGTAGDRCSGLASICPPSFSANFRPRGITVYFWEKTAYNLSVFY